MAISRFLARLGFVRIGKYGLVLTPDDRIMSTRPAVLDDGLGGKIVGWDDGDLAAMELERWQPMGMLAKPAPAKIVALPPPPPKTAKVMAAVSPPVPVQVAPAAPTEDDEWEWEIAVAKARAAADPIPADNWPKTQELREDVKAWEPEPLPRQLVMPHQRVAHVPAKPPTRMPKATPAKAPEAETTKVRPVLTLRAPSPTPAVSAKFEMAKTEPSAVPAKATRQTPMPRMSKPIAIEPPKPAPTPSKPIVIEPPKPTIQAPVAKTRASSKHEETIRTLAVPPANDDRTDTAVALPPAPVIASTARRLAAARQR
jgi:hypothetical protein